MAPQQRGLFLEFLIKGKRGWEIKRHGLCGGYTQDQDFT
jgi:hypothetical protein